MRLLWAHTRSMVLLYLRTPEYITGTLLLPLVLFLFFAVPNADSSSAANFILGSFMVFAVLGVAIFQFGVGIATERSTPWEVYLRTLPLPMSVRTAARFLNSFLFALLTGLAVLVLALLTTPVSMGAGQWARFAVAILLGLVPFTLLGIAIGYSTGPRAAIAVANMLWLPLSFLGGLWVPPDALPSAAAKVSPYLPTRRWGNIVWDVVRGDPWRLQDWLWLLGYTLLFLVVALWFYRRDEGQNYV